MLRIQPSSECVAHVPSQNWKLGLFSYLIGEETGLWASLHSHGLEPTFPDLFGGRGWSYQHCRERRPGAEDHGKSSQALPATLP